MIDAGSAGGQQVWNGRGAMATGRAESYSKIIHGLSYTKEYPTAVLLPHHFPTFHPLGPDPPLGN